MPTKSVSNDVLASQITGIGTRIDRLDNTLSEVARNIGAVSRLDERLSEHMATEKKILGNIEDHEKRLVTVEQQILPLIETRKWVIMGILGILGLLGVNSFNAVTSYNTRVDTQASLQAATAAAREAAQAAQAASAALPVAARAVVDAQPLTVRVVPPVPPISVEGPLPARPGR